MLDIKYIRANFDRVLENTRAKHIDIDLSNFLEMDKERRTLLQEVEGLKNTRNVVTEQIAQLKKKQEDATSPISQMKEMSDRIKILESLLREKELAIDYIVHRIPNVVQDSVPHGADATSNIEVRKIGEIVERSHRVNHIEISKRHGILDFERGAKVSGSGFGFYVGKGAALERAMINFMIDFHVDQHGYTELFPPFLVNSESMFGTGQLPKFADDAYHMPDDNLYLIPTAEVPITNFYRNEVLNESTLPLKHCGYSACFRREAGSYGKDTKGFLRVHQFNKVEMVKFTRPHESSNELETLVNEAEDILKAFELPYRVIELCDGDTGFSSAKTYDIEVWSPCEEKWLEVSSCSNFESFQSRRANIRYRTKEGHLDFVHTLNGSGLATSRIMVAILEHHQMPDGRIRIPEALRSYCRFDVIS